MDGNVLNNATDMVSGFAMASFAAAGIFFLRFWFASKDKFFLLFFIACEMLSLERLILFLVKTEGQSIRSSLTEGTSWVYLIRLTAFLMILAAIIHKNNQASQN